MEDERHALYDCPLYDGVRGNFVELLQKYPQVTQIFNPVDVVDACLLGKFLIDIETILRRPKPEFGRRVKAPVWVSSCCFEINMVIVK